MRTVLMAASWLIMLSLPAIAQQAPFDLKGLRLGMTGTEAKTQFPSANCYPLDGKIGCVLRRIQFGNVESADLGYQLRDDIVSYISVSFEEHKFTGVAEALKVKFGAPVTEETTVVQNRMGAKFENLTLSWTNGDVTLRAAQRLRDITTSTVSLMYQSTSDAEVRLRKEKADAAAKKL